MAAGENHFAPELNENKVIESREDMSNILGTFLIKKINSRLLDYRPIWEVTSRYVTWFRDFVSEDWVKVFAQWWTFVRCLAAQIVRTERRSKEIVVFPQSCRDRSPKSKLWASNVERLSSPVLEGKILPLMLLNFTEFAVTILYPVWYVTWCKAQFTRYIVRFLRVFLN